MDAVGTVFAKDLAEWREQCVYSLFPRVTKDDIDSRGLVLFGAGGHGRIVAEALKASGAAPRCFVDKNPELAGSLVCGIPVRPLANLAEIGESFIMLASCHIKSMIADCERYGVTTWILPSAVRNFCFVAGEFGILEQDGAHAEALLSAFSCLADEKSRAIYRDFIKFHHTFEVDLFKYYDPATYFAQDLASLIDYRHFVDAGAFTGDTLKAWLAHVRPEDQGASCVYHAFEPCLEQFSVLEAFVRQLPPHVRRQVLPVQAALSDVESHMVMAGEGAAAHLSQSSGKEQTGVSVPVHRLDTFLADACPTVLKADVEGFELPLLKGAEGIIRRCRPALLISVYHKYADIWEIPLWIHQLDCGYHIYLRHHYPAFGDTVCYAISHE